MRSGALEHQMFEKMREPGFARRLVGGADLVPDHLGDHRGAWSGITTTCMPLGSVKLAGRSEVTVVWARTLAHERVIVNASAANKQAERCKDIMTCQSA